MPHSLNRAFDYPYSWPADSYVLKDGRVDPFTDIDLTHRQPVLAIGSNRAPCQLLRKFGSRAFIPVERVLLKDYDIVFGARLSRYGAVPATPFPCPGVIVNVAINWLTDEQLDIMHRTEGVGRSYFTVEFPWGLLGRVDSRPPPLGYVASAGALKLQGELVALSAVSAVGRTLDSATSREILERVGCYLDGELKTSDFVAKVQHNPDFRARCLSQLRAVGVAWPNSGDARS